MATRSNPEAIKKILAQVKTAKVAKVGFFESAKYPDGTPVAYVAAIQEFGYPEGGIPARSFIRTTISEKHDDWSKTIQKGAKAVVRGKASIDDVVTAIGLQAEGDMREKVASIRSPALAFGTLDARWARGNGSDKPLVDTGYMLSQLISVVEPE